MDKKNLIICIVALAALIGAIAFGISSLYSGKDGDLREADNAAAIERFSLLQAIPSDAAMILYFKDLDHALSLLTDSTKAFSALVTDPKQGTFDRFVRHASAEKYSGMKAAISVHFSGDLIPLLICNTGRNTGDTTAKASNLIDYASLAGLHHRLLDFGKDRLLLISRSETLIHSSVRHIDNSSSILEDPALASLAPTVTGSDVIFVSNNYAGKIMGAHLDRRFLRYADFFKRLSGWTAFQIEESKDSHLGIRVLSAMSESPSCWFNVARRSGDGESRVAEVLPYHTDFVISQSVSDLEGYFEGYKAYLDACSKLDTWKKKPETWARELRIREVAKAEFHIGTHLEQVLLVRTGSKQNLEGIVPNEHAGFVPALFGPLFSIEDDSCAAASKEWLVFGGKAALEGILDEGFLDINLRTWLSDAGLSSRFPAKGNRFSCYWSPGEDPSQTASVFRGKASQAILEAIKGIGYAPFFLTLSDDLDIRMDADRVNVTRSQVPTVERDTVVVVPQGPFKVHNSGTNATNLFYQAPNLYLCLKEESGKGIWGVPFKTPICGSVETIDWYANGKNQFLFGAGSSLYLIDRLGRFVKGFPVDLGKEILIGPAAYDFSGAHGYSAVVLHKDNTIAMYNLHGKKPDNWKDITASETIKGLPELITVKGKRYWVVRTSIQTLFFPFMGGDALKTGEKNKMVRPDSPVEVSDNTVKVLCYDGKQRTLKW